MLISNSHMQWVLLSAWYCSQLGYCLICWVWSLHTFQLKLFIKHESCDRHRFGRFVGVRVGVAYSRNKLALRARLRNLNLRSQFSIFDSFRDIHVHTYDFLRSVGGLWALKWA